MWYDVSREVDSHDGGKKPAPMATIRLWHLWKKWLQQRQNKSDNKGATMATAAAATKQPQQQHLQQNGEDIVAAPYWTETLGQKQVV